MNVRGRPTCSGPVARRVVLAVAWTLAVASAGCVESPPRGSPGDDIDEGTGEPDAGGGATPDLVRPSTSKADGPVAAAPDSSPEPEPAPAPARDAGPDRSPAAPPPSDAGPSVVPGPDGGSSSAVPVGSRVVFTGDYETGNFGQWGNCQSVIQNGSCGRYPGNHYSLRLVSDGGQRQGKYAARFEIRNGDVPNFGGGERTEVASSGAAGAKEGDERWFEWSMKFEDGFPATTGWGLIVMQWHDASNSSPPLALHITGGGGIQIGGDGVPHQKKTLGPIRRGWVDYVLHVKFSRSAATGFVEGWENGVKTVARYNRATMRVGDNYLKMGLYRDSSNSSTQIVYQDGLRITAP